MTTKQAALIHYDVPVGVKLSLCWPLRAAGFVQASKSVYIGFVGAVGALPIHEWREAGARVHAVAFAVDEWGTVRAMAREALEAECHRIRAALARKLERTQEKFDRAERLASVRETKKARGYVRGALRGAKKMLAVAQESALFFDLMGETGELFGAVRRYVAAEQETWFARAALKVETAKRAAAYEQTRMEGVA
jgi:hypothetical protein